MVTLAINLLAVIYWDNYHNLIYGLFRQNYRRD